MPQGEGGQAGDPRPQGALPVRRRPAPHVHTAQRLTVPITKRAFGTTHFWNPLQNFLLAKFKCASRVPSAAGAEALCPPRPSACPDVLTFTFLL